MCQDKTIRVVFGADNLYAMPVAVVISSILVNLKENSSICFYILDGGFSETNKQRFQKIVETRENSVNCHLEWIKPNLEEIIKLPVSEGFNFTVYLRLLIPEILPEFVEKVIYLDGDLIVEKDLTQLWSTNLSGHIIGATQNTTIPYVSWPLGIEKHVELGLSPDTPYLNAGVILMDLHRWRANRISQRTMAYVKRYKDCQHLNDQEALNAVLGGQWKQLDSRWNQQPNVFILNRFANSNYQQFINCELEELSMHPWIIHYCARAKPWHYNCSHPMQYRFFHYLKESNWFSIQDYARFMGFFYAKRLRWMWNSAKQTLTLGKQNLHPKMSDTRTKETLRK